MVLGVVRAVQKKRLWPSYLHDRYTRGGAPHRATPANLSSLHGRNRSCSQPCPSRQQRPVTTDALVPVVQGKGAEAQIQITSTAIDPVRSRRVTVPVGQ